jgi:NAD-dependent SIR2 family protein deacetylase
MPTVCSGTESFGLGALGGSLEPEKEETEDETIAHAYLCATKIKAAQGHTVLYTGAGISTSAGIKDYRGPKGVWTSLATGVIPDETFDLTSAHPTFTHACIKALVDANLVAHVCSTNLDALHMKSGLTSPTLSELHGNMYVERCTSATCGIDVRRSFPIRRRPDRLTGRACPRCSSALTDSGIDFGQNLPANHLNLASDAADRAQFSLVVGSSMRVAPASTLPFTTVGKGGIAIVNLMDTPRDAEVDIRSYAKADLFFYHLMEGLGLPKPRPKTDARLLSATQMKALAKSRVRDRGAGVFVGEEQREKDSADALFEVEGALVLSGLMN